MKTYVMIALGLLFTLRSFAQVSNPALPENGDKTLSPYFFVKSDDPGLDQMPLKSTSAEVNIAGVIAAVKVTQVYQNTGKKPLEAIYVFPASTRAAVHALRMQIGERVIEAVIKEKKQARQDYEEAKQQGKSASLLEQQRPNVFQMNVANIMPGDVIRVELDYTELLIPENGTYEFVYPTVVGPRYSNQPAALAQVDQKWVANPYTKEGVLPFYTFNLQGVLNAGMPVSEIRCSTHELNIRFDDATKASFSLKDPNSFQGNRDFILQYRLSGNQIQSGVLLYEGKDENFFLAMIQPPKQVKNTQIPPREYVFIVDVSGSMYGYPLDISKKLLKDLLGNLRPVDKFNIVLFAGASQVYSPSSLPVTPDNISKATAFIDRQSGGGGTELLPALNTALGLGSSEGCSRTFIIATDGYVTVEKESFELIRNNLGKTNFFAFGIGTSVNRYLIEGIAHTGMGQPYIITKQEEAESMAFRFRDYIQTPVLTDIQVRFKGLDVYDVEPKTFPDVFSSRPVVVFGKYKSVLPTASVELTGTTGEGDYFQRLPIASGKKDASSLALRYLWARERIRFLDDFNSASNNNDQEGITKQVTELGLKYNLLTQYTSFIAVDSESRNKEGGSTTIQQPLPLPEGVSNYAVGGVSLQKSTSYNYTSQGSYQSSPSSPSMSFPLMDSAPEAETYYPKTKKAEDSKVMAVVETLPEYPGGSVAMKAYLEKNLIYPKLAKEASLEGVVIVSFIVKKDGSIANIKILKSLGKGCDEEAIRLIKTMPKWIPGKQNGKAKESKMTLQIRFALH